MNIQKLFDALIEQTQQRGGSPSVRNISDAAQAVNTLIAACSEVNSTAREQKGGPSLALHRALHAMNNALVDLQEDQ